MPKHAPTSNADIVRDLQTAATVDAATRLLEIAEGDDKAIAKRARTALYQLKLKGIVPSETPPQPAQMLVAPEVFASRAWLTGFGGTGARMLLFMREDPHGGSPFLITFLVNNQQGVIDLGGRKLPRKQLEEKVRELAAKEGTVLAEASVDYARWVLRQAADRNASARAPIPEGFGHWSRFVGEPEATFEKPPVYDLIDADAVRSNLAISHNPESLFEHQPFVGWMLELREVDPWEEKFFESQQSRLVLDKSQVELRGERIIDEAADALMAGGQIADYRTRLEETAYVLHLLGREDQAKEALFHAVGMRDDHPPHTQPLARALVKRSIFVVIALKAEQEPVTADAEEPGLIERV